MGISLVTTWTPGLTAIKCVNKCFQNYHLSSNLSFHLSSTKKRCCKHRYSQPFTGLKVLAETRHEGIMATDNAELFQDQGENLSSTVVVFQFWVPFQMWLCRVVWYVVTYLLWLSASSLARCSLLGPLTYLPDLHGCLSSHILWQSGDTKHSCVGSWEKPLVGEREVKGKLQPERDDFVFVFSKK